MTKHSEYLLALGRRVLGPFTQLPGVVCAAITGSAAEGHADEYSDLDSTIYYETLPSEEQMQSARARLGSPPLLWTIGARADGEFAESFRIDGVECQIGHTTVAQWEKDLERTLGGAEPGGPLHKAMSGTLVSIPVVGTERLDAWKARLREYPEALRVAMARHHLKFFALWGVVERLDRRDAGLWVRQTLVDSSFNLLGTLAGVNRKFFTSFQFKRADSFVRSLEHAPKGFGARLESLWRSPIRQAARELRGLVAETVDLVEQHLSGVDTAPCRRALQRDDRPWNMPGAE